MDTVKSRRAATAKPALGQVWADNDHRAAGRTIRVDAINEALDIITITVLTDARNSPITSAGTTRRISRDRLRPTSRGYQLISA